MFEKLFYFVAEPMGTILNFIYETVAFKNYGVAIILFTLVMRFALLPLMIKQYRSTAKMQKLQPEIQNLQVKYKNDPQKLNEELMKFYKENEFNPAAGCLPLFVQMPILFSLIYVIGKPLTYMKNMGNAEIAKLIELVPVGKRIPGFYEQIGAVDYHNLLNMDFLGVDLGHIPTFNIDLIFNSGNTKEYLLLLLIPILATLTTYISTKMTTKMNTSSASATNANDQMTSMTKSMTYMGPIMTLVFSFQFPAGLGLYWIVGYLFQILQQLYMNKYVINKEEA